MRLSTFAIIAAVSASVSVSCANTPNWQKGAGLGAAVGAGTGAVIGHQSDHAVEGALIGGAVGAVAGGLVGRQLDEQQAELSRVAEVQRTSEEELVVVLHEKVLFDVNEYALKPGAADNLAKIADVVKKYPDFLIVMAGHTDSTGSDQYNLWLSEQRAKAVADFLISQGVDPARIQTIGHGETMPVTTNDTPEGRQENRRVELHITPLQA